MIEKGFSLIAFIIFLATLSIGIIGGAYYLKNNTKYFSNKEKIAESINKPNDKYTTKEDKVATESIKDKAINSYKESSYPTSTIMTNGNIISAADKFVASLVGEAEFKRNYRIDLSDPNSCKNQNQPYGCYIRYIFLPGNKYGKSEYLFFSNNNTIKIANNNVPLILPSCEKDINNCDFKVSADRLKEIAGDKNLRGFSRLVMYENQIVAVLSYCDLNTMANRRKIYVDLQDGAILWEGENSECQGII